MWEVMSGTTMEALCEMSSNGSTSKDSLGLHLNRKHEVDEYGDCLKVH
jgi:hypothetical protein